MTINNFESHSTHNWEMLQHVIYIMINHTIVPVCPLFLLR